MGSAAPSVHALLHHLVECPIFFMAEPMILGKGEVVVPAVVSDLLQDLGGQALDPAAAKSWLPESPSKRNWLRLTLITCWLLNDPWFCTSRGFADRAREFLQSGLLELAGLVDAEKFLTDPDRREELVRTTLRALQLVPLGEMPTYARDRLTALDSVERDRLLRETQVQQQRAAELRQRLQAQAAQEAAAKVSRE